MKTFFKRLFKNEKGLTLPEYGIGLALAVLVGAGALSALSTDITSAMGFVGTQMEDPENDN